MSDQLTGLDSYEEFIPKLKATIREMSGQWMIALMYVDIKHFKYFNDTYGYRRGNELLSKMATMVSQPKHGYICGSRVVSDNIVVAGLCDDLSQEDYITHIKGSIAYLEQILRREFSCDRIRVTAGVFFITDSNKDINLDTAVSNANLARKQSKLDGNESVTLFVPEMAKRISNEMEIISSIDDAIKNKELRAYYQPKIDSITGQITGAEALVRWIKPDGSMVYPDEFIPILEKTRQIINVDYFIYNEVFAYIRNKLDKGEKVVPISVNVSRQHLRDLDIIDYVSDLLDNYKIPPQYLEFELTETLCIEKTDKVKEFINAFHSMGIKVSMDDFGSGFSSLKLLSEIPIDVIKLDRCFLNSADLCDKEKIIITSIINMTKQLKIHSLCEGVETLAQSDFLSEIGCDAQQGYYYSKPVNVESFDSMLLKMQCVG